MPFPDRRHTCHIHIFAELESRPPKVSVAENEVFHLKSCQ
jgi:hypothetical protein